MAHIKSAPHELQITTKLADGNEETRTDMNQTDDKQVGS